MARKRTWTDEQLRDAVATSTTYRGVLRTLRLAESRTRDVQQAIARLGIDARHFTVHRPKQLCADDELRDAVRRSKTCTQVLVAIGAHPALEPLLPVATPAP